MDNLLRFITCGSVDDGKSTLIGHMLYEAKLIFADQEHALELDSKTGSRNGEIDYSLLLDGLMAEREQGITIDVAYRYFATDQRSFIVADTPGHEQYTRNMAVGASFADLAIILVDATQGLLPQTKRHARICWLMGIRHFVLAVNKMDLIGYDEVRFETIHTAFSDFCQAFGPLDLHVIPVSATLGDNLTQPSIHTPYYTGLPLLRFLETVNIQADSVPLPFVMPVQRVSRPDHTFRGFQGQIESGSVHPGDPIIVLPSKEKAIVKAVYITDQRVDEAGPGHPVTITLDREVDVSRGCVLSADLHLPVADLFTATLLWMDDQPLIPGRNTWIKLGTKTLPCTVLAIKHQLDIDTGAHCVTDQLHKNELGVVDLALSEPLVFDVFSRRRGLGSLILIDRITHMTSACGTVDHELRRATNITWHPTTITRELRAAQKHQKPLTLWFTGLSGSGKSTLANAVEKRLVALGKHTMLLDGDNLRHGLNRDLGFKETDRVENIRRVAEVARILNDAGLIAITAFISPYESDRQNARSILGDAYREIYVSTPLDICEQRDPKGLYQKARAGEIPNFTGVSSPYETPTHPDLILDTHLIPLEEAIDRILRIAEEQT